MNQKYLAVISKSLLSVILATASLAQAADFSGNVSGYLGAKNVDSNDWEAQGSAQRDWNDYSDQSSIGVMSDFKMTSWPISIAIDAFASGAESKVNGDKLHGGTAAVHLGVRKIWDIGDSSFHPYLGGGLAIMGGTREQLVNGVKDDDRDATTGGWIGTGLYWRPHQSINIGLDLRYSSGDVELFSDTVEAGGTQVGILVGYHW